MAKFAVTLTFAVTLVSVRGFAVDAVTPVNEVVAGIRYRCHCVPFAPWLTVCGEVPVIEPFAPAV